jgi:hypothetical protein
MAAKDWTKLYEDYKGLWVALKSDETTVVSSAEKLKDVLERAKELGCNHPIVTKVPKRDLAYIGIRAKRVKV